MGEPKADDPQWAAEGELIAKMLDRAHAIGADDELKHPTCAIDQLEDKNGELALAVALVLTVDRWLDAVDTQRRRMPTHMKCGYCALAAGDDDTAWQSAATMTLAEARAHSLVCQHHPLVKRRDELLKLVARISQETPLPDEMKGWEAQRSALIAEVGTLKARVAELEAYRG